MGELMDGESKRNHEELKTLHEDIGRIRDELARPQLVSEEVHVRPAGAAAGQIDREGRLTEGGDAVIDISERSDDDTMPDAEANGR